MLTSFLLSVHWRLYYCSSVTTRHQDNFVLTMKGMLAHVLLCVVVVGVCPPVCWVVRRSLPPRGSARRPKSPRANKKQINKFTRRRRERSRTTHDNTKHAPSNTSILHAVVSAWCGCVFVVRGERALFVRVLMVSSSSTKRARKYLNTMMRRKGQESLHSNDNQLNL